MTKWDKHLSFPRKRESSVFICKGTYPYLLRCYRRTYYLRAINGGKAFLELIDILQDPLIYCKQHGERPARLVPWRFQHSFYVPFSGVFAAKMGALYFGTFAKNQRWWSRKKSPRPSLPRTRESRNGWFSWIPAFAGMTKTGHFWLFTSLSKIQGKMFTHYILQYIIAQHTGFSRFTPYFLRDHQ